MNQNGPVVWDDEGVVGNSESGDLPVFVVRGWSGQVGVRNRSAVSTVVLETGQLIKSSLMSVAIAHRDNQGCRIDIWSHRPQDPLELKHWAPTNTMLAWLQNGPGRGLGAKKFNRMAEKIGLDILEGRRPWGTGRLVVDDHEIDLEIMEFDETYWAGVAYLDHVHVTIASVGVPLAGLELRRTAIGDIQTTS